MSDAPLVGRPVPPGLEMMRVNADSMIQHTFRRPAIINASNAGDLFDAKVYVHAFLQGGDRDNPGPCVVVEIADDRGPYLTKKGTVRCVQLNRCDLRFTDVE